MAGRKCRSRKNNWHNQKRGIYKQIGRKAKNKELRQQRHQKKLLKQEELKAKRIELLEQAKEKTKLTSYGLKRKFGTLNIRRLSDIIEGVYTDRPWYKNREINKSLIKKISKKNSKEEKDG